MEKVVNVGNCGMTRARTGKGENEIISTAESIAGEKSNKGVGCSASGRCL